MGKASASARFAASIHQAELLIYDTARWPEFVDGLARVVDVTPPWPDVGGRVEGESGPAGRGRVSERVISYEPRRGQSVEVADDSIDGIQSVEFAPAGGGVAVQLALDYRIRRRNPLTPLVDLLFIRRLMTGSLERTLSRFGVALHEAVREGAR